MTSSSLGPHDSLVDITRVPEVLHSIVTACKVTISNTCNPLSTPRRKPQDHSWSSSVPQAYSRSANPLHIHVSAQTSLNTRSHPRAIPVCPRYHSLCPCFSQPWIVITTKLFLVLEPTDRRPGLSDHVAPTQHGNSSLFETLYSHVPTYHCQSQSQSF